MVKISVINISPNKVGPLDDIVEGSPTARHPRLIIE